MPKDTLSKFQGCLMGVVIGDAMGIPWECLTYDEILSYTHKHGVKGFQSCPREHHFPEMQSLTLGESSDDWQLTSAVAASLIERGGYYQEHCAQAFVSEYKRTTRGWGKTTRQSVHGLSRFFETHGKEGRSPSALPEKNPREGCGNGVAMRISPIPLFYYSREKKFEREFLNHIIVRNGTLTHPDIRASIAACAISHIIATILLENDEIGPKKPNYKKLIQSLLLNIKTEELKHLEFGLNPDIFFGRVKWLLTEPDILNSSDTVRTKTQTGCFALESVPFSIATFLRQPTDFRAGVLEAINAGGDTDTNASMVGAMIGANVGIEGIPKEWREFHPTFQQALDTANELFQISQK